MIEGNTARKFEPEDDFRSDSDDQLISLIANPALSSQALNELMKRHATWIYRICLMRLGNSADAQDVTQEVMIRVQKYASKFKNRSAVRTWLYRIAQNQCNTFANKFKHSNFEQIDDYCEVLTDTHAEKTKVDSEVSEQIHHVMSKLSEQCRTMIKLRYFDELSLEEISKRLNIGLSATKMRLYRALEQFKNAYSKEAYKFS